MKIIIDQLNLKRYSAYRDSGVEWLGEIPQHWKRIRMKYLFHDYSEKNREEEELLSVTQNQGVVPRTWVSNRMVMPSGNLESFKFIQKGDFAISLRSFEGGLEYCYHDGIISPAYTVLKAQRNIYDIYYKYLFKSFAFISELQTSVVGIREGKNISYPQLSYSSMPIPTLEEQTQIANFLDDKTAKIDQAIQQKERLIELLQERKQIIIQNAVTRGLNPKVKMKDSGVDWIGEIPEGWEVKKLGLLANVIDPQPDHRAPKIDPNGLPYLGIRDINADGTINIYTARTVEVKAIEKQENSFTLKDGDILYGKVGTLGLPKRIILGGERVALSATLVIVQTDDEITSRYLKFALDNSLLYSQIQRIITGATRPALGIQQIRKFMIPFPNHSDIENVVNFLELKEEQINLSIKSQKSLIKKLKEYKQVLINEVVTGKVKV